MTSPTDILYYKILKIRNKNRSNRNVKPTFFILSFSFFIRFNYE